MADLASALSDVHLAIIKQDEPLHVLLVFWELAVGSYQPSFISGYQLKSQPMFTWPTEQLWTRNGLEVR